MCTNMVHKDSLIISQGVAFVQGKRRLEEPLNPTWLEPPKFSPVGILSSLAALVPSRETVEDHPMLEQKQDDDQKRCYLIMREMSRTC